MTDTAPAAESSPPAPPPASEPSLPSPPVLEARKVSIGWRVPLGVLWSLFLGLVFIGAPLLLIPFLNSHDITTGGDPTVLILLGGIFAFFEGARYVAKPTRAYGPFWILSSGAFAVWLIYLYVASRITLSFITNVTIVVGFNLLLGLLAIVPILTLIAAIVTTVEDIKHPGERMPFDFPVRRWGRRRQAQA